MGKNEKKNVRKRILLILGALCVVSVVLAGFFAYGYFTNNSSKNSQTPEATPSASPSASPIATPEPTTQIPASTVAPVVTGSEQPNVTVQTDSVYDHIHDQNPTPILDVSCTVTNVGTVAAYNVILHIEAYSNLQQKALDLYVSVIDTLGPQTSTSYANGFIYEENNSATSGINITTLKFTPEFSASPPQ